MPDYNAAKSVHQYLLAENIQIDLEEFTFQAKTHPDYPAVLAYSDTLHFFGISNKAVRLGNTELEALPQQFMALLIDFDEQEMLAFVQRKDAGFQYIKNGKLRRLNHAQFEKEWKGVILLVEGQEEPMAATKNEGYKNVGILVLGGVLLLAGLLGTYGLSYATIGLVLMNFAGFYLSVLAIKAAMGMNNGRQPLFCTSLPKADCNAVIGSGKGTLLRFVELSDACIVFFSAQLLTLMFFIAAGWTTVFYAYTLAALVLALPVTFYSIYVQIVGEKKWCTICLAITGLLYLQGVVVWLALAKGIEWGSLWQGFIYMAFFVISLGGWLVIKARLTKYKALRQAHQKAIGFKKNYELFRYLLLQSQPVDMATAQQALVLGNAQAALQITLITNPFCGYCAGAHTILLQLLKSYGDKLCIAIRFNYTAALNAEQQRLHRQLINQYQQKGSAAFLEALGQWFAHKDHAQWNAHFATAIQDEAAINDWLWQQASWNQAQGLNFTPAFVIGPYLYPMAYEREELLYFIPDLLEDTTLSLVNP